MAAAGNETETFGLKDEEPVTQEPGTNDIEVNKVDETENESSFDCSECLESFGENKTVIFTLLGCLCVIGVLLIIILIPVSIRTVEHDEYAVRYDDFSNTIYENIYTEGKFVLTPQTVLFKFSNLVKKMEIDLTCLTANGIVVDLDVDVQYQLPQNQVFNAFKHFGEESNIEKYLTLVMTDSVRDSCGKYDAKDYYENRLSIQNTLEDALVADVRKANAYYNITAAVLSAYDFPDPLEDSIKDKRAAENDIAIAENERDGSLVEAETVLLTAKIEAEKLEIEGDAEVDSVLAEANAQSTAIHQIWINRQSVYDDIMGAMNMSVDRFVYQYLTSVILLNAEDPITDLS